jgi:hypothetical protein
MKRRIVRFTERVSKGLSRPEYKFVTDMIYGILSSQSSHLSKIARALNETIKVKKTIERLSRNLSEFREGTRLFENYIQKVKGCVSEKTILILDDGDITKPCSTKLESMCKVRDGSTGEIGLGYHMLDITALTPEQKAPIGVYSRVYSSEEEQFVSADDEVLKGLRFLRKYFKRNNIRAFDRGFDANIYYEDLIDHQEKFVIRAKKNRDVIYKDERINIMTLAERFKGKYSLKYKKKNGREVECKISIVPIRMCCRPKEELNLVICRNIGREPLLLITSLKSDDDRLAVTVTKVYLLRWRIEEFHGFKKQQFHFEDLRVRSLNSIRNLDMFLTIAIGYIGMMSEQRDEKSVVMELIHISKRIFNTPRFPFYAIADGIHNVFSQCKQGISYLLKNKSHDIQLSFFSDPRFRFS